MSSVQNWLEKGLKLMSHISSTNGDRKMEIKSKRNFKATYMFIKLFCQNHEILTPCCDIIKTFTCMGMNWIRNTSSAADMNSIFNLSFKLCYRADSFWYVIFGPHRLKKLEATRLLMDFSLIIHEFIW